MKKLVLLSFVAMFALALSAGSAQAVSVSPPILELDARKGDVITEKIRITNDSDTEKTYYVSVERFVAEGEGGAASFIPSDDPLELANWINFSTTQVTIGPEERKVVPFSISVPTNADPGGHYASVFLSTTPPATTGAGSQVSIGGRVGVLILVRVEGNVVESASILDFAATPVTSSLPTQFKARVQNQGNVHLKPRGNITINNMLGGIAAVVDVNNQGSNVLPDSVRELDAEWVKNPNSVAGENASFWSKYRQERDNFALGKYTADLSLVYGGAGKTLSATTTFWVIPWRYLLVKLIWLAIIVAALVFGIKKYNEWIIAKATGRGMKRK